MNEKELKEWIIVASFDVDTVELLVKENGHAEIIIFHIHQAIEKLLKALLVKNNYKIKKTHLLDELLSMVIDKYSQLSKIKNDILEINLYLPKLRYPYGDRIEYKEALYFYKKFKKINKILSECLKIK
jgi:HEPN domain-containing protein